MLDRFVEYGTVPLAVSRNIERFLTKTHNQSTEFQKPQKVKQYLRTQNSSSLHTHMTMHNYISKFKF